MKGTRTDPLADPAHVLVVGAGPGIAAGIARRFAREGCRLTLVARDEDRLRALAAPLRDAGVSIEAIVADAGDPYALRAALAPVFDADPPGVVVYNAARALPDDLLASDEHALESAYSVNVVGAIVAAQLAAPPMRAAGGGTIIFTGAAPGHGYGTLTLGKQSLRAVAEILAEQLASAGVHVAYAAVAGPVCARGPVTPDVVGDAYWAIHVQRPEDWRTLERIPSGH